MRPGQQTAKSNNNNIRHRVSRLTDPKPIQPANLSTSLSETSSSMYCGGTDGVILAKAMRFLVYLVMRLMKILLKRMNLCLWIKYAYWFITTTCGAVGKTMTKIKIVTKLFVASIARRIPTGMLALICWAKIDT